MTPRDMETYAMDRKNASRVVSSPDFDVAGYLTGIKGRVQMQTSLDVVTDLNGKVSKMELKKVR
jgi:hypothetical protein